MDFTQTYSNQTPYYLAFSLIPEIGIHTLMSLMQKFGTPENAYQQKLSILESCIGKKKAENICTFRKKNTPHKIYEALYKNGVQIADFDTVNKSQSFLHISPKPICLYIKGSMKFLTHTSPKIAIVGTRKPTLYGTKNAQYFSQQLTSAGFSIISGMAAGIDSCVHRTCIDANGYTVAIIGSGILAKKTASQEYMQTNILASGGTLISEFSPYAEAQPGHFVIRNRVISGLADATLVIEGTGRSGACITARYAAEQGKDVYCIPGNIDSANAECTNRLIKNGAHLVTSPEDIIPHFIASNETSSTSTEDHKVIHHVRMK